MSLDFNPQPVLEDANILLRPLQPDDFEGLCKVAADPKIWEQHPAKERSQREGFTKFFDEAIQAGTAFLIIDKVNNEVMGTSRYHLVKEIPEAIEIGWTFIARKYWGGQFNRAVKQLMINHAFTKYDDVLFYIHHENIRSQKAVEKIGGKRITRFDGMMLADRPTASVVYCINKSDWNSVHEKTGS